MTTREIAKALADAAGQFPLLGEITAQNLLDLVKWDTRPRPAGRA
jgi:hypothetical protein